jgi:peptide/nickel transport system substrate-binding protein
MAVFLLSLFAPAPARAAQVIRMGLSTAPVTLDPRFATDAVSERICHLLYRPLVDFDETYHPVPALADWRALSPTHYRFTLRDAGRRFSDGTRLEAIDVKATYDYILAAANA